MDCSKFEELTDAYIENSLSDIQKQEFEQHMRHCASCKDSFEFSSQIYNTLHNLQPLPVPDSFLTQLNAQIDKLSVKSRKPKRDFFRIPVRYYGAVACILLAIAVNLNGSEYTDTLTPEPESSVTQSDTAENVTEKPPSSPEHTDSVKDTAAAPIPVINDTSADKVESAPVVIKSSLPSSKKATPKPSAAPAYKNTELPAVPVVNTVSPSPAPTEKELMIKEPDKEKIEQVKDKLDSGASSGRVVIASSVENSVIISEESVENTSREVDYLKSYALVKQAAETKANPAVVGLSQLDNVQVVSDSIIKYMDHDGDSDVGAVGNSVIVYKRDAEKISDILQKFYTRECGEFYVISDSDYEQFLNELEANGIDYQKSNKTNTSSKDIMFKLVIA